MLGSEGSSLDRGRDRGGSQYRIAIGITVCLFFLWGMANNLNDILIAHFKKAFVLTDFETSFVQQVFYFGYFIFAIPASLTMTARGYKVAIVTGLLLYGCGALLFYPAATLGQYPIFLFALFVIAAGLAFLETSANPLMTELGSAEGATRRLNWAQAANPLGAIAGILIGRNFILSGIAHDEKILAAMTSADRLAYYRSEIQAVQTPYVAIGIVVLAFAVVAALVRFPGCSTRRDDAGQDHVRFASLLGHPRLLAAVVAQFFYVGAQVGIWSFTIRYAQANVAGMSERAAADMLFVSLILFAAGRFVGSALMTRVKPTLLLACFAACSIALALVATFVGGHIGLGALVAISFFMSIQFPSIFALGVEGLGPLRRAGASLIVMAIIGGAILTGAMGYISDLTSISGAMIVPSFCFVAVLLFARFVHQRSVTS
ncbi:L-fucose:H+ symporter permease [Sphingobium lactosutens]|uniref:L-fucose:H+ symporter permease n=1 Tax=Sphingobium lactosutens TaxID=522773 RepID=UPI0015B79F44|nr:L-fucose:H+ symporter permease [Sphingobium lactosutens]NWK97671.1 L-fucose:H+ symporter permease [Sphingobium lactosutens]